MKNNMNQETTSIMTFKCDCNITHIYRLQITPSNVVDMIVKWGALNLSTSG